MARKVRGIPEINAGSMADIAFLLLVFFLVTTTMDTDKGLRVKLPPWPDPNNPPPVSTQNNRNVLEVLVNSNDQLLVEGQISSIEQLTERTKEHLTNEGRNPNLAESSLKAIVSLKNDRGTSYERYVEVYNELKRAYNEVRDEYSNRQFNRDYNKLNQTDQEEVQEKYPMKISEAEPVDIGGN
jgi:biopolymer transport protein ExbD